MSGESFTCSACGGTFEKEWTDEEARAEADAVFGKIEDESIVCDDCYARIMDTPDNSAGR